MVIRGDNVGAVEGDRSPFKPVADQRKGSSGTPGLLFAFAGFGGVGGVGLGGAGGSDEKSPGRGVQSRAGESGFPSVPNVFVPPGTPEGQ